MSKKVLKIKQKDVKDLTGDDQVVYVPCNWVSTSLDVDLRFNPIDKKLVYILEEKLDEPKSEPKQEKESNEVETTKKSENKTDFKEVENVDLPNEVIKPAPQVKRGRPRKNKE